jgi:outer membrane protein assembly factor BamB
VYISSVGGTIHALDVVTGEELWQFGTGDAIYASPIVANGSVFVGSTDGSFYALSEE